MHLILTGATGLVGSGVLHHVLSLSPTAAASKKITRLSILSRRTDIPLLTHPDRPTSNTYTQIEVILHTDFKTYSDDLLARLGPVESDQDGKVGVIWALGISQNEVKTAAEYIEITKDYAIEAAKAFRRSINSMSPSETATSTNTTTTVRGNMLPTTVAAAAAEIKPHVNFIYVSGEGAQHQPSLFTPLFGKIKGETELELLDLMREAPTRETHSSPSTLSSLPTTEQHNEKSSSNFQIFNIRPAGVDSHNQPAVHQLSAIRDHQRPLSYRILKSTLLPVLRTGLLLPNTLSPTEELGTVFVQLALSSPSSSSLPLLPSLSSSSSSSTTSNGSEKEKVQGRIIKNQDIRRMYRDLVTHDTL